MLNSSYRRIGWSRLRTKLWITLALASAVCLLAGLDARAANVQPLEIVTKTGVHVFSVEMATTEEEKTTGLMYRKELADGKGMLFDFSPEQEVSMWMKNTYIPLDMIFVSRKGRVVSIARNATPMSEAIISSGKPAYAVIEVNAGVADKLGIAAGDAVRHPIFQK